MEGDNSVKLRSEYKEEEYHSERDNSVKSAEHLNYVLLWKKYQASKWSKLGLVILLKSIDFYP